MRDKRTKKPPDSHEWGGMCKQNFRKGTYQQVSFFFLLVQK